MERGYIKLWRKTLDTDLLKNRKLWAFWGYCLMKASYKKHTHLVGFQEITLEPGQFVFGRKQAATELGMSEQNVRTCLKNLKKSKNLTIETTSKFSIITIINWNTYQSEEMQFNQRYNQQVTNNQPTSNQQVTTNKNSKKGKNRKEGKEEKNTSTLPKCPYKKIIDSYHEICPELSRVVSIDGIKSNLKARWREMPERQNIQWWEDFFINQIQASDFLMGRAKDFQCNLGWIVGPKNFSKILNGQYVNRGSRTGTTLGDKNAKACEDFIKNG